MAKQDNSDEQQDSHPNMRAKFAALGGHSIAAEVRLEDVRAGLKKLELPCSETNAAVLVETCDRDNNGTFDYEDFTSAMDNQKDQLNEMFSKLDQDGSGNLNREDVAAAYKDAGIHLQPTQLDSLFERADRNQTGKIERCEWTELFLLHPVKSEVVLLHYWAQAASVQLGEDDLQSDAWKHLTAGGAAGMVSRTVTAPLDRLKTLLMVQALYKKHGGTQPQLGLVESFLRVGREGGILSYWKGNLTNITKILPESSVKFLCYEQLKRVVTKDRNHITTSERFVAAGTAGIISQTVIYPLEVIKTRLVGAPHGMYSNVRDVVGQIVRKEGYTAFYRGLLPSLIGIVPGVGIDLTLYETFRNQYTARFLEPGELPNTPILLMCGVSASSAGYFVSYPFGLVRTRLAAQGMGGDGRFERYSGAWDVVRQTVHEEGVVGLYRGMLPHFMKVLPAAGISYVVYEKTKELLGAPRD